MRKDVRRKIAITASGIERMLLAWFIFFSYCEFFQITRYWQLLHLLAVAIIPFFAILHERTVRWNWAVFLWICYAVVFSIQALTTNGMSQVAALALQQLARIIVFIYCLRDTFAFRKIFKLLLFAGMIHAVATVAEFIVPTVVHGIQDVLLDNNTEIVRRLYSYGYYCGITDQAGFNAAYISIAFIIIFPVLIIRTGKGTVLRIICAMLALVALLLTGKRGFLLAAAVAAIFIYFMQLYRQRGITIWQMLLLMLGSAAICYLLFYTDVAENIIRRLQDEKNFLSGRDRIWKKAWNGIVVHPVLGNGTGSFSLVSGSSAHNSFLQIWYENGLVGLVMVSAAMLISLRAAFSTFIKARDDENKIAVLTSIGYQLYFIIVCMTDHLMQYHTLMVCYFIFAAIPYAVAMKEKQGKP